VRTIIHENLSYCIEVFNSKVVGLALGGILLVVIAPAPRTEDRRFESPPGYKWHFAMTLFALFFS
jgi:hypothetical protein